MANPAAKSLTTYPLLKHPKALDLTSKPNNDEYRFNYFFLTFKEFANCFVNNLI